MFLLNFVTILFVYQHPYFDFNRTKCLWVRTSEKVNKVDILWGVSYRPPNHDEEADRIFCKQLRKVSQLLALFLVGDLNLPDVC